MHHKRRRRRRAGIKGCCGLCMLQTTDGRRNGRLRTRAELSAALSHQEQVYEARHSQALDGTSV